MSHLCARSQSRSRTAGTLPPKAPATSESMVARPLDHAAGVTRRVRGLLLACSGERVFKFGRCTNAQVSGFGPSPARPGVLTVRSWLGARMALAGRPSRLARPPGPRDPAPSSSRSKCRRSPQLQLQRRQEQKRLFGWSRKKESSHSALADGSVRVGQFSLSDGACRGLICLVRHLVRCVSVSLVASLPGCACRAAGHYAFRTEAL